jgi:hypothetical protein
VNFHRFSDLSTRITTSIPRGDKSRQYDGRSHSHGKYAIVRSATIMTLHSTVNISHAALKSIARSFADDTTAHRHPQRALR